VSATIQRFDRTERIIHWVNATLFVTLMLTGAVLYVGDLSALVGRRNVIKHIHVYAGLALPVPVLIGLLLRSGTAFRADVKRLSRWIPDDKRWWSRRTRDRAQLGKFNPGQKLNASFVAAAIIVMLATGSIMFWFHYFSDDWRTGATFVHDWFAFFIWMSVLGHIGFALRDPASLNAMVRGPVPEQWAIQKRPRWYVEVHDEAAEEPGDGDEIASGTPTTAR
jgi:formate dehydrogenase subunit gamma